MTCTHLTERADTAAAPTTPGECEPCVAIGSRWVHLRVCLDCGQVGCCDSSPNKHASAHYAAEHHPVIESGERGENWRWCFVDSELAS